MSRHSIRVAAGELVVGWDPPLSTYFGQLYDPTVDEDRNPVVWVGLERRVSSVLDLVQSLQAENVQVTYAQVERALKSGA